MADAALTLTFLGSGGNSPIPMPTCSCEVCEQARREGVPYARHGNSMYLHEMGALVDAPEFVYTNFERAGAESLDYVLLTHWHPDHVNGLRVVQSRDFGALNHEGGWSLADATRTDRPTLVTTEAVYERTCEIFGSLRYFVEEIGFAELHFLDEEPLEIDDVTVSGIPYALTGGEADATAFIIERGEHTLAIASDDAKYLDESLLPDEVDLAVFECGLFEETPDGDPLLTEGSLAYLADEPRHAEIINRARRLNPGRTYLTEIEHITGRSHDDLRELEHEYEDIYFAYDGLTVEV